MEKVLLKQLLSYWGMLVLTSIYPALLITGGEPPDLRDFDAEERASRMKSWRSFIRNALSVIVMGRLDAPHLAQRVDAILMQALDVFLSDPDIIERYNLAFSKGWKSFEWQDIPTLKDFSRFCSIARLNIQKPEAIDHQAINLLHQPSCRTVGKSFRHSYR